MEEIHALGQHSHRVQWLQPNSQSIRCLLRRNRSVRTGQQRVFLAGEGIDMAVNRRNKVGSAITGFTDIVSPLLENKFDEKNSLLGILKERYGIVSLDELPDDIDISAVLSLGNNAGRRLF